jgi:hypothetical protein
LEKQESHCCIAYHAIRKKFPLTKDESFTRFEMEEEDKIFE